MLRRRCKKCGCDVKYCKTGRGSYSSIFLIIGGCMLWIPLVITWLIAAICFILAPIMLLIPPHYFVQCKYCRAVENITKEEYKEVMK